MLKFIKNLFDLRSSKWNYLRKNYLIENNKCIACGTTKKLNVHHIEPVHVNYLRELDENNLCTLCQTCHFVFGHLHNWSNFNPKVLEDAKSHLKRIKENGIKKPIKKPFLLNLIDKIFLQ